LQPWAPLEQTLPTNRRQPCYARVRPYLDAAALTTALHAPPTSLWEHPQRMLFNSGRAALEFLLADLAARHGALRIGVQAFTCDAVVAPIVRAGHQIALLETDTGCFSTPLRLIDWDRLDVLLLTHLFGIPNPNYQAIINEARTRGIVVIEDLAQTVGAKAGEHEVGTLADAAFYSHAFDKPIAAGGGGTLCINTPAWGEQLWKRYQQLPRQSAARERRDLATLALVHAACAPERYRIGQAAFGPLVSLARRAQAFGINPTIILRTNRVYGVGGALRRLARLTPNKPPRMERLGATKQAYLQQLWAAANTGALAAPDATARAAFAKIGAAFPDATVPACPAAARCAWFRTPVRIAPDRRVALMRWGRERGIELAAYNWPRLCTDPADAGTSIPPGGLAEAEALTREIVNVPLWSPEIWSPEHETS